ncbi:MAG TPA: transglycosylase domain-containing protein, partial [Longilinea sp.]|nr:transglycosylase domain-containing protein [Longilinea sp.]
TEQRSAADEPPTQPGKHVPEQQPQSSFELPPIKNPPEGNGRTVAAGQHPEKTPFLEDMDRTFASSGSSLDDFQATRAMVSPDAPTIPPPPGGGITEPLPQRVNEMDMEATRVNQVAYTPMGGQRPPTANNTQPGTDAAPNGGSSQKPPRTPRNRHTGKKNNGKARSPWGCLVRVAAAIAFVGVLIGLGIGSVLVYQYFRISADLPSVDELIANSSQFETVRIYDRENNEIYQMMDPNAGMRTYVPLDEISPYLILTTIATEDKNFFTNPGYDLIAMFRALYQNYITGEVVSGASTITQQLARILLLSPEERYDVSLERKAREIILAAEITRQYTKEQILELYLNEINYGNLAYGIEAASEMYFNTTADQLTLGQAAFLAGIPQAPWVYDIYTNPADTLHRTEQVLTLTYDLMRETGDCIDLGYDAPPVCLTTADLQTAAQEIASTTFTPDENAMQFPHWVMYIRALLEEQYGPDAIYRLGLRVYTTLDPYLQSQAEQIVQQQVSSLTELNVQDGALVAIQPSTGEILAMVGSADFYNEEIAGQINMAVQPRQPGSSIKPITYTAAFEAGWTPSTLIWDVPIEFPPSDDPNDTNPPYIPENYDGQFHGAVTVREALARSLNIPAVRTLDFVGLYDNPDTPQEDGFLALARRMGITTLTQDYYGLALTLGGGEVTLLELTGAYSIFANQGIQVPPVAILRVEDSQGNLIYEYTPPAGEQVIRAEHAYLISSILSDNQARSLSFGTNSVLNLPFPAAAKTGTTNDFRDNWTMGYTPDLAVGVWVGNADYTPMVHSTGITGAAPIWSEFMQIAVPYLTNGNPSDFVRPAGIVDQTICSVSGTLPSQWCPSTRNEVFAYDQLPLSSDHDLWADVHLDTWTGYLSSSACSQYVDTFHVLNTTDTWAQDWIENTTEGANWAQNQGFTGTITFPTEQVCRAEDPHPEIVFVGLSEDQNISTSPLDLYAVIRADQYFQSWTLDYSIDSLNTGWIPLVSQNAQQFNDPQRMLLWDISSLPSGRVTLRIRIQGEGDRYAERWIHLNIMVPTPTPSPTPTATVTPTETLVPTPTETPTP